MCTCDFDMMFAFVYDDWERITANACVSLDVLTRLEVYFPWPNEITYLVDFGYPYTSEFPSSYQGERYHLQEHQGRCNQPIKYKELFNYRYSSFQKIIERYFDVLKIHVVSNIKDDVLL